MSLLLQLSKFEDRVNSESKNKDIALKQMIDALEEQSDAIDKIKRDITKRLESKQVVNSGINYF